MATCVLWHPMWSCCRAMWLDLEGLFVHVLAGDVVWAARACCASRAAGNVRKTASDLGRRVGGGEMAARESWQDVPVAPRKTLCACGRVADGCRRRAHGRFVRSLGGRRLPCDARPFAEYLLFVWEDGCDEARHGKVVGGLMPMLGETGAPRVVGLPDVPASQPESDRDQALTLSDAGACCRLRSGMRSRAWRL